MKHTKGPFVLAIATASGHDLKGRRDWQGRMVAPSEPDDFGRSKTVIAGTASLEDWNLFAAAPLLLDCAELTLEIFQNAGLGSVSPEAAKFEATLKGIIAQAKGEK
jgi:hypothetical protein